MLRWLRAPNPSLKPTRSVASALRAPGGAVSESGRYVVYAPTARSTDLLDFPPAVPTETSHEVSRSNRRRRDEETGLAAYQRMTLCR